MADCQKPWSAHTQPKQEAKKIQPNCRPLELYMVIREPSLLPATGTACNDGQQYGDKLTSRVHSCFLAMVAQQTGASQSCLTILVHLLSHSLRIMPATAFCRVLETCSTY